MSLRHWNSVYQLRELEAFAEKICILYAAEDKSCENYSSSGNKYDKEEENSLLPLLFTLGTLEKHSEFHTVTEDTSIEFGCPMVIYDFNKSQCISHFCFRKNHLKDVSNALWLQLNLMGIYDSVICRNIYICPFETVLLVLLYRLSRPRRIRPDM